MPPQGALWAEGLATIGAISLHAACITMIVIVRATDRR